MDALCVSYVHLPHHVSLLFSRSVMSDSATPGTAVCQASLSFTISLSLLRFMSIESVMPSNYLILCHPLVLLLAIFPTIRVSSNESALCIRWPKYWSFGINPSNEYSGGHRAVLVLLKGMSHYIQVLV